MGDTLVVLTALALKPFTFNKGEIFPRVEFGVAVKLQITYIGKRHWGNLTLTSIAALIFYFFSDNITVMEILFLQRVMVVKVNLQ